MAADIDVGADGEVKHKVYDSSRAKIMFGGVEIAGFSDGDYIEMRGYSRVGLAQWHSPSRCLRVSGPRGCGHCRQFRRNAMRAWCERAR